MRSVLIKNYFHLFFLTLLFLHYFFPLIFVGEIIVDPRDSLEIYTVQDHIISKIYKGYSDSLSYFLSGEFKWYYLENLFFPINILHYVLNDKLFYFTNDLLIKIFAYFSFFLLAKFFKAPKFLGALGGLLYSTLVIPMQPLGFGLSFFPYILYLLLSKESLNKKHYFALLFISLHTSFIREVFGFLLLIPLSIILKNNSKNLNIYIKVFSIILVIPFLSSLHLVVGSIFSEPTHRVIFDARDDIILAFLNAFNFLFIGFRSTDFLSLFKIPIDILFTFLLVLSFFSNHKKVKLLLFFIIVVLFLQSILGSKLISIFFIGFLDFLSGFSFDRVDRILPLAFTILFVLFILELKKEKLKKLLYFISFVSILSIQLQTPLPQVAKFILQKNMKIDKFFEIKKQILESNYISALNIITKKENYSSNEIKLKDSVNKTFDNYFKFDDYAFIKNIVKKSKIMSVGLDPMVAVMNDIKVIDGYYTIYPLKYKIKFRKIIEKELENNAELKNYFDTFGSRVYAFYNDKNNIMLNFKAAKTLGADYILSSFPIKNNNLKVVCYECNNLNYLFLYKIL